MSEDSTAGRAGRRPRPPRGRTPLDVPRTSGRRTSLTTPTLDAEIFGRWSESFARYMGTAWFIVGMTVFVGAWLGWNTYAPAKYQFDPKTLNYTLLTLILSLQASYAAPLILLAQNRQADRDRVALDQDRQRAERNLADTEYLAREVAALRIALRDVATRDFVRSELRDLLEELLAAGDTPAPAPAPRPKRKKQKQPHESAPQAGRRAESGPSHEPVGAGEADGADEPAESDADAARPA